MGVKVVKEARKKKVSKGGSAQCERGRCGGGIYGGGKGGRDLRQGLDDVDGRGVAAREGSLISLFVYPLTHPQTCLLASRVVVWGRTHARSPLTVKLETRRGSLQQKYRYFQRAVSSSQQGRASGFHDGNFFHSPSQQAASKSKRE